MTLIQCLRIQFHHSQPYQKGKNCKRAKVWLQVSKWRIITAEFSHWLPMFLEFFFSLMVPMLCLIPPYSTPIEGTPCLLSLLDHNMTLARRSLRWRRGGSKDPYSWPRDGLRALWFNYGKELMLVISCWVVKFPRAGKSGILAEFLCLLFLRKWYGNMSPHHPWRRKWQPTPVSLPGKSHRERSLVGCSPWGHKESGTTEWMTLYTYTPHHHSLI